MTVQTLCRLLLAFFVLIPVLLPGATRPNILFLFTDDQRADTISALGNPAIHTPNLDRLARSGVVFTNAYCMGSDVGAVCRPSRNMLLSGRHFFRFKGQQASANKPNWPDSFNRLGYVTYHHGKRGNSATEIQNKFQINKYLEEEQKVRRAGEPGKIIVDDAIDFLKTKRSGKPFFLYLAFATPHDPRVAAPADLERYQAAKLPLPKNYLPVHPFDNGEMTVRDELLAPWPRTPEVVREHLRDYYGVITGLDTQIGRLLSTLRDLKLADNTIVIFSSDHGLALGSHGLFGKQSLYEHSMKPPLILAGPGIRAGKTDALVYLMDLFPTAVDLVGGSVPAGLDGKSLKPVIDGPAQKVRDTLFLAYGDVQRAVRDERYKLIRYPHINKNQLFDLKKDPHETHNLADDPGWESRTMRMMRTLRNWQAQVKDPVHVVSTEPRPQEWEPPAGAALEEIRKRWKMR